MTQAERIQQALDQGDFPDWVSRREVELIEDAYGDPAARVSLIVREGNDLVFKNGSLLNRVRDQVHQIFDAAQVSLWPFVRFVSEAEA